jgi:hypothetical protein
VLRPLLTWRALCAQFAPHLNHLVNEDPWNDRPQVMDLVEEQGTVGDNDWQGAIVFCLNAL